MKALVTCLLLVNLLLIVFLSGNDGSYAFRRTKIFELNRRELENIRVNSTKYFTDRNTRSNQGLREIFDFLTETTDKDGYVRRSYEEPSISCDFETSSCCGYKITSERTVKSSWERTDNKSLGIFNITGDILDERHTNGHFVVATVLDVNGLIRVKSPTEIVVEPKCLRFSYIGNGLLTVKFDMIGGHGHYFPEIDQPFIWRPFQVDIPVGNVSVEFEVEQLYGQTYTIIGIDNIKMMDGPCSRNNITCPSDLIPCVDNSRCIYSSQLCDVIKHCSDGSDESKERCLSGWHAAIPVKHSCRLASPPYICTTRLSLSIL